MLEGVVLAIFGLSVAGNIILATALWLSRLDTEMERESADFWREVHLGRKGPR